MGRRKRLSPNAFRLTSLNNPSSVGKQGCHTLNRACWPAIVTIGVAIAEIQFPICIRTGTHHGLVGFTVAIGFPPSPSPTPYIPPRRLPHTAQTIRTDTPVNTESPTKFRVVLYSWTTYYGASKLSTHCRHIHAPNILNISANVF